MCTFGMDGPNVKLFACFRVRKRRLFLQTYYGIIGIQILLTATCRIIFEEYVCNGECILASSSSSFV